MGLGVKSHREPPSGHMNSGGARSGTTRAGRGGLAPRGRAAGGGTGCGSGVAVAAGAAAGGADRRRRGRRLRRARGASRRGCDRGDERADRDGRRTRCGAALLGAAGEGVRMCGGVSVAQGPSRPRSDAVRSCVTASRLTAATIARTRRAPGSAAAASLESASDRVRLARALSAARRRRRSLAASRLVSRIARPRAGEDVGAGFDGQRALAAGSGDRHRPKERPGEQLAPALVSPGELSAVVRARRRSRTRARRRGARRGDAACQRRPSAAALDTCRSWRRRRHRAELDHSLRVGDSLLALAPVQGVGRDRSR